MINQYNDKKAIVVYSGGQDSTTCLIWALTNFKKVKAISFDYGQKHQNELDVASKIAFSLKVEHQIVNLKMLRYLTTSALFSNSSQGVNDAHLIHDHLPASFVPNRNALFLTLAHAHAQQIGHSHIVTGVCQTDYSGYPDCRDNFIKSINVSLNIGSESNIEILTPLMYLDKKEIWQLADNLGAIDTILQTHTCYNNSQKSNNWGRGCGTCPACKLRSKGFQQYTAQIGIGEKGCRT
ncbi:MAG: 7-cyano-7-deazaguanine synthase [Candidatus Magnetoglobus multicellularis str. Araruama]|uniref:7-cyano-7-deazaguanine synthase n=1 Tax=Candidatus Magnetoglobus multicellularis str. Araruama TaxID=890399 RepID=A0A1V1PDQ8_9BACT|nr:MAG: 7-cyano-7-deazaguanine synthase [Candidatus Magnetoglobus multicellularis str. Araruama]